MSATKPAGLEGVVAGDTAICSVEQGALIYRGYEIHDLAANACFEDVAYLLLHGEKPNAEQSRFFKDELIANRALSPQAIQTLKLCGPLLEQGSAVPMDVVRTVLSVIGNGDADCQDNSPEANLRKATRIVAKIPTIIGHMQNIIDGKEIIGQDTGGDANLSHAANLLYMMTGERPTAEAEKVMDVSLILYAEHDYNASTFTSRVIAGTLSDMHGAMTGADRRTEGPAPRRCKRGSDGHARRDHGIRQRRQGQRQRLDAGRLRDQEEAHGLRSPRLQERRPPGPHSSQART